MKNKVVTIVSVVVFLAVLSVAFFFFYTNKAALGEDTDIVWDGSTIATSFSGGNGTKDNPYLIKNGEELAFLKQLLDEDQAASYQQLYYELTSDINLGSHPLGPIATTNSFMGNFDGKGYSIKNIVINGENNVDVINYYGLFGNVYNADISNLNIDGIKITAIGSGTTLLGSLAGKIDSNNNDKDNIKNISIRNVDIDISQLNLDDKSKIGFLTGEIGSNYNFTNIFMMGNITSNTGISPITSSENSSFKNIVYSIKSETEVQKLEIKDNKNYSNIYEYKDLKYYSDDKEIAQETILDNFNNNQDTYEWSIEEEQLIIKKKQEQVASNANNNSPKKAPGGAKAASDITEHDTGNDTATNTTYINDFVADRNYLTSLNYTGARSTTLPTGASSTFYDSSNLVAVQLTYDGHDINNSNLVGAVSPISNENTNKFVYYKYYALERNTDGTLATDSGGHNYIRIELIDNPFSKRPYVNNTEYAFNGWTCNQNSEATSNICSDATFHFKKANYTRYVDVAVTGGSQINLYLNASWVKADVVTRAADITDFNSMSMQQVNYSAHWEWKQQYHYFTYDGTTVSGGNRIGRDKYYRTSLTSGTFYYGGNSLLSIGRATCPNGSTCYIYSENQLGTNLTYNGNSYIIAPNFNASTTVNTENTGVDVNGPNSTYMNYAGNYTPTAAGMFYRVTNTTAAMVNTGEYYTSNGTLCTDASNCATSYKLIKYNDSLTNSDGSSIYDIHFTGDNPNTPEIEGTAVDNANYYYLVTRDTNIFRYTRTTELAISNLAVNRPFTVTGTSATGTTATGVLNISANFSASNDLVIENINVYKSNNYTPTENAAYNHTLNTGMNIMGNSHNLKIGRNVFNDNGNQYLTANVIYGGNTTNASGTFRIIVESGIYTSYRSGPTSDNNNATYNESIILGSDYDRANNNNSKLKFIAGYYGPSGGNNTAGSDSAFNTFAYIKSGRLGYNVNDSVNTSTTTGLYIGGYNGGNSSTNSCMGAKLEGGLVTDVIGGQSYKGAGTTNYLFFAMTGGNARVIYGGAATSKTYGNRIISISGGTVEYGVLGGSDAADATGDTDGILDGSTLVYIGGNATIGNKTDSIRGVASGTVFGAGAGNSSHDAGAVNNSHVIVNGGTINSGVYGGGNWGSVGSQSNAAANSTVDVLDGTIKGDVYGAGNNVGFSTSSYIDSSTINVNINGGTIEGSVYGGSNVNGTVYGTANVNANGGTVQTDIYGGGKGGYNGSANPVVNGTYMAGDVQVTIGDTSLSTSPTINGNVYGGSAFGTVNGTSENDSATDTYSVDVTVNKGTIVNDVFGGGKGGTVDGVTYTPKEYGDITVTINGGSIGRVFGGNDLMGSPGNDDIVYLNGGTIGNAFGGGNNTGQTETNIYLQGATITNNLFGGSNESGAITTSNVTVTSGTVQNVFGANNLGGTTTTTNVDVSGGTITNVYGGGNKVGAGTTNVEINSGTISAAVYGGSNQLGDVSTSNVTIDSSTNIPVVYGGNNAGGTTITTNVEIISGTVTSVYGGGNQAISGSTNVDISGGTITNVYGGGNLAKVTETDVDITGGTITNVYGGGNQAAVDADTSVNIQNVTISNNVYGGGNQGEVLGNSDIDIKNANINGSAYAGGNEAAVRGNTTITIEGSSVIGTQSSTPPSGCVFGSGNSAATGVSGSTKTATVNIVGGTIYGNVYGGANTSVVYGVTDINIGTEAVGIQGLTEGNILIVGTIFGGGESNASGSPDYDYTAISVTEGINIDIDGTGYANNNHTFELRGSVFGSGNASSSQGDSTINIKKLGTLANPSENISIQRTTYLTIDESVIHLKGAKDITNKYSNDLYSLNMIGTVQNEQAVGGLVIKNNTTLLLDYNANQLVSFKSAVDVNGQEQVATVDINDNNKTVTKNVDNRIYLLANKNLNVTKDADGTDYGKVTGMTFFGVYRNSTGNITETGIYDSSQYTYGSAASTADLVIASSYVLGLHSANHDITKDGFYTNYLEEDTNFREIRTGYIEPTPPNTDYYRWLIGTGAIEYEFTMTASKYLSMGTHTLSLVDFPEGDTTFTVLGFDASGFNQDLTIVDENEVPRFARTDSADINKFGLNMKSESTEWTSINKTTFLSADNGSFTGNDRYLTNSEAGAPNLMFYLYHAKNIELEGDLGTVIITLEALSPKNGYEVELKLVTIKINVEAIKYSDGNHYDASITYGKKYEMPVTTPVNITTKSQFTEYYSLIVNDEMKNIYGTNHNYYHTLVSNYALPVGTTISFIDLSQDTPKYYYYEVDSTKYQEKVTQLATDNEITYLLSDFLAMDTTTATNKYNDTAMNLEYYDTDLEMAYEEFLFIFDFKDTNLSTAQLNNEMLFELRTDEDRTLVAVLDKRLEDRDMVFNLHNATNIELSQIVQTANTNYYYDSPNTTEYSTQILYSANGTNQKVIDTNYEASRMGINIQFFNDQGTNVSSSMLSGTKININGVDYFVDSDGIFRIKLADKVTKITRNLNITVDSNLPPGEYTVQYSLIASSDGVHASDINPSVFTQTIQVISSDNTITVSHADKTKIFYSETGLNEDGNSINAYQVKYNSDLTNANLRLSIYKRKVDSSQTTEYEEIEYTKIFTNNLTGTGSSTYMYEVSLPFGTSPYTIPLTVNPAAKSGTYKLVFKLCDGDQVVDTDDAYLIVKKPVVLD